MVASGNASYTEMFNTGPGSLYFSGPNGRVIVTQSQDGNTFLNPATGAQSCTLLMRPRHLQNTADLVSGLYLTACAYILSR